MRRIKAILWAVFMTAVMIVAFRKVAFCLEAKGSYTKMVIF